MKNAFILACIAFRNMMGGAYSSAREIQFEAELTRELLK